MKILEEAKRIVEDHRASQLAPTNDAGVSSTRAESAPIAPDHVERIDDAKVQVLEPEVAPKRERSRKEKATGIGKLRLVDTETAAAESEMKAESVPVESVEKLVWHAASKQHGHFRYTAKAGVGHYTVNPTFAIAEGMPFVDYNVTHNPTGGDATAKDRRRIGRAVTPEQAKALAKVDWEKRRHPIAAPAEPTPRIVEQAL